MGGHMRKRFVDRLGFEARDIAVAQTRSPDRTSPASRAAASRGMHPLAVDRDADPLKPT